MKIKRELFIILSIMFFIGFISAIPLISFVNPTPDDGTQTTGSSLIINTTITGIQGLLKFVFQWQGTNYTLYDEDLILHLNLNNNSLLGENNSHVYDSSRAGHNGTVSGDISSINGKYQGGISINADNEFINLSDHADFRNENFTISFWYNKSNISLKEISAFGRSTCLLLTSGRVYCVGDNDYGQLGDDSTTSRPNLEEVSGGYTFNSLCKEDYSDSRHICGLLPNGTGLCWGNNGDGQIGDGTTTNKEIPTIIQGNYNFSSLYCGKANTCGILQNGSALCWGDNSNGQLGLGNGNVTDMYTPRPVYGNKSYKLFTSGDREHCGILHNGSALCWGRNDHGQIGNGSVGFTVKEPAFVYGEYNFTYISAGNEKVCAILVNKSAFCWGNDDSGSDSGCMGGLGDGGCSERYYPTATYGNYNHTYFEATYDGYCSMLENSSVFCWGENGLGQLGNNGTGGVSLVPKKIYGNYTFNKISSGNHHSCGITTDNMLLCWGDNSYGQTGKGISSNILNPTLFSHGNMSSGGYKKFDEAAFTSCGLLQNGSALCWGWNVYGQVGDNTTESKSIPTFVYGEYNFKDISCGGFTCCGIEQNGSGLCWGANPYGQIGNGDSSNSAIPLVVYGEYNFSLISPASQHTCGLLTNGSALCWGRNNFGQLGLGNGNDTQMFTPTYVFGGYNFTKIFSDGFSSCGLLTNGSALCWGRNQFGQLGNPGAGTSIQYPIPVIGNNTFTEIIIIGHTCGLLQNGTLLCWGRNDFGQLGLGSGNTTNMKTPYQVSVDYNFSSFKLSGTSSCGLLQNGTLLCWGRNNWGQLGDGTEVNKEYPIAVKTNGYLVNSFHVGYHIFANFTNNKGIFSWGLNSFSQQAVEPYNYKIPSHSMVKGTLFGKGAGSFIVNSGYGGDLIFFANSFSEDLDLSNEYQHIVVTYNGKSARIYKNGNLEKSFNPLTLSYPTDLSSLIIGQDARGQIDEILMWNITLSASEINQVYRSNFQQRNHTSWEFYSSQTLPSVGTYTYKLFVQDTVGWFSVLRNLIKYVETTTEEDSSGGAIVTPSYTIKEDKLQEGQSRQLRQGYKVTIDFARQGKKILNVVLVDKESNLIKVSVENISNFEITNGTTEKIDVNSDGFYDLEVTLEDISNSGSARINFKEIYQEIPSDNEDEVQEQAKQGEETSENNQDENLKNQPKDAKKFKGVINNKFLRILGIIIGIVIILSGAWILFVKKIVHNKKIKKKSKK